MRAIAHAHAQKSMLDEAMEKQAAQDYQVNNIISGLAFLVQTSLRYYLLGGP